MSFSATLQRCRVLPVITPDDVDTTLQLCTALSAGGMTGVELTLRTPAALDCIGAVKSTFPELTVAAGTVLNGSDMRAAQQQGADFCVSPGLTPEVLHAASELDMPLLPGVATASDIMLGLAAGLALFKLFPAQAIGGATLLRSFGGPFPQVQFCPTGGLTPDNYRDYLALPNVVCCGGSWMASPALVRAGDWVEIERLAAQAMTV